MAEAAKEEVKRSKVTVKHVGKVGQRVVIDVDSNQHVLGPGMEAEIELAEPEAERMRKAGQAGHGDLVVGGAEPEEEKDDTVVEAPEEHSDRKSVAAKEAELMKAGQEAGKDFREKYGKMDKQKLAARTGIGIMARDGLDALATVAAPPDAPEEVDRPRTKK